jgi:hypothetical protein
MRKAFKQADDYMIQYAMEIWPKLTEEERLVLWLYTDGSRYVNEEMLGTYALKLVDPKGKVHNGLHDANILTSIIEKAPELRDDVWMQSGKSIGAFDAIFGTNLRGTSTSDLSKLVGREGRSNIFMSCHSARDGAFTKDTNTGTRNDVVLTIFMPKGTKGMYCEPFASYGDADRRRRGIQWDGKSREAPGDQVEFLLQRSSKFRITKAEWDPIQRKWFIDVDLIEQEGQMALDELIPNLNRRTERQARS